jgi:hypothetical protein
MSEAVVSLRNLTKKLPGCMQDEVRRERRDAIAAAKKFADPCRIGDLELFSQA